MERPYHSLGRELQEATRRSKVCGWNPLPVAFLGELLASVMWEEHCLSPPLGGGGVRVG